MDDNERAENELEEFGTEFDELMAKYSDIQIERDTHGDLIAYHTQVRNTKIYL